MQLVIISGTPSELSGGDFATSGASMMDQDDHSMDGVPQITRAAQAAMQSDIISELGRKLLSVNVTCEAIVLTIFK